MLKLLLGLSLLAIPACGGHLYYGLQDGGESSSSSSSNTPSSNEDGGTSSSNPAPSPSTGSPFPVCPGSAPLTGSACLNQNQGCAYVNVDEGTCASWTCSSSNVWVSSTPEGC
jgi:hypothetical protein